MASDTLTLISSIGIRLCAYVFLRWIPTTIVPPAIYTFLALYIPSFITSFLSTSPYKVISDEIDIIVRETVGQGEDSTDASDVELLEGADDGPLEELDVEETVVVEEKGPHVLRTLLTGLPSPSSAFWSWVTFAINMVLVGLVTDAIFRARVFHPAHDLSFARVGYVSDSSANILVREPHGSELPIFVSYRRADPPLSTDPDKRPIDTAWKSAGSISWLSNETDYTAAVAINNLKPDSRYQYSVSNNHTGYFITAPRVGEVSRRNGDKYTFLHSSCIKPRVPYNPFSHPLHIPGLKHLAEWIPKLRAHFMLFLGDFIYVDVPLRMGKEVEDYRREYRQVYASPEWPTASKNLPWIHVIDDHEIANDWDGNTTGVFEAAYDPWTHYQVAVNPPSVRSGQTYFHFTQGPASFFMLDTRRYRSPAFDKDPWDTSKTMLGRQQLHDLLTFLKNPPPPGVRWKIIASSIPFTKNWRVNSVDTWAGYLAERQMILEAMWTVGLAGGVGVVVLSGDRHEFAATAFPPPSGSRWPLSATVHEFSTSPLSMFYLPYRTYKQEGEEEVCIKYIPDGNSKFGAVEITSPPASDQSQLHYRLFVDGKEEWSHTILTPPDMRGAGRAKDAIWG
ncbi:hypothetical protein W97_02292 [Coniosporium apollinis CBS 100218]|uniref:PhoD-like phosphatase metallophosphatase domain-containing protein n=1 Tax=Coniosporium apollinis (strain CBS 100218) TaxID=1168221 RepID=R7YMC9_CONA1|nr:uncharacterized protein W97_02292 [Coniosporium apollinis CBS 100218]EON63065.1 hypothetical protein W97_02292 [Coniosporium apollinis CBS 100218]